MLLHISERSEETLQEQIIGQIRARVLCGDLEADQALPSIRGLAKTLKVSVITVQRAYEQLLNENLVYSRRGKGFFVASIMAVDKTALAEKRLAKKMSALVDEARRDGLAAVEIKAVFENSMKGDK